jgi:hypothetical protein
MSNIIFDPDDDLEYEDEDDDEIDLMDQAIGVNNGSHALLPNLTINFLLEAMMSMRGLLDENDIDVDDDIEFGMTLILGIAQEADLITVSVEEDGSTLKITNL